MASDVSSVLDEAVTRLADDDSHAAARPTVGPLDEMRERADVRLEQMHAAGIDDTRLYGRDPNDGVSGAGAFFLLMDEPEVYGLPPDPVVTTRDPPAMWRHVGIAALTLVGGAIASFLGRRSR